MYIYTKKQTQMKDLIKKHESIANGFRHVESLTNQLNVMQRSRKSLKRLGFSENNLKISAKDISRKENRIKRVLTLINHIKENH